MFQDIKLPRIIVIDGVGINLKTSLMNKLHEMGYFVIRSDSSYYNMANNDAVLFPRRNDFAAKIQCRFMEIMAVADTVESEFIFVDRGIMNQVVWSDLNYRDVIDDYLQTKDEFKYITDHFEDYLKLEDSLIHARILLETQRKDIVENSLDPSKYKVDDHATFRIETYYHVPGYFEVQEEYINTYNKYTHGDFYHLQITDEGTVNDQINKLVELTLSTAFRDKDYEE